MSLVTTLLEKLHLKKSSINQITIITTTGGGYEDEALKVPLIGNLSLANQYRTAKMLIVAFLAFAVGATWWAQSEKTYVGRHQDTVTRLQSHMQELSKHLQRAGLGVDSFLKSVFDESQGVGDTLGLLRYTSFSDMPELTGKGRAEVDTLNDGWRTSKNGSQMILENNYIGAISLRTKLTLSLKDVRVILADISKKRADWVARTSSNLELQPARATLADAQLRLAKAAAFMDAAEANVSYGSSLREFVSDLNEASSSMKLIRTGGKGKAGEIIAIDASGAEEDKAFAEALDKHMVKLASLSKSVDKMLNMLQPEVFRSAAQTAATEVSTLLLFTDDISAKLDERQAFATKMQTAAIGSAILLAMALWMFAAIINAETKNRALSMQKENTQNQNAIMRLLEEMSVLADGDLTARATVSEDITGAIADSVNFTVSQLSGLVSKIEDSAGNISVATQRANELAEVLQTVTERQTADITVAGRSVISITNDIELMAKKMENSADVAKQSVAAASRGSDMARETMNGIENIAQNAEETAKRMRRLGESSQQISEIVELIADISEQTSVLAINATVQATKAGVAGKGFKVVADAVQDLANRAADATRRIGALITATQTDIQAVFAALEKTNVEVRNGEVLSKQSQEALGEIADISESLSKIVLEANSRMNDSAKAAVEISETMRRVLDSVKETTETTGETNKNIATVNKLSEGLREAVMGFKI